MKIVIILFFIFLISVLGLKGKRKIAFRFKSNNKNITELNTTCDDPNCDVCDMKNKTICIICKNPLFLFDSQCIDSCPYGTYADNLRDQCANSTSIKEISFTKVFSIQTCNNHCGKIFDECSCEPSCKLSGICCTDYMKSKCDSILSSTCNNVNFTFCDYCNTEKCLQCKDNYVLYNNTCILNCPTGFVKDKYRTHCFNATCSNTIENCIECEHNSSCTKCERGYFLHNNKCILKCPDNLRGDRQTWKCVPSNSTPWYWVYPSKSSCEGGCEKMGEFGECSCYDECVHEGNCCSDYDPYCGDMI